METQQLDPEVLTAATDRWVGAGVLTPAQRDAILTYEHAAVTEAPTGTEPVGASPGPRSASTRTVPVLAEIAGYLGLAIAVAAASFVINDFWSDLTTWARLLLVATITLLFGGAAASISWRPDAAVNRLANLLWLLATCGFASFLELLGSEALRWDDRYLSLAVAALTAPLATSLLWWRRGTLQHLAVYATYTGIVAATLDLAFEGHVTGAVIGIVFWGVGMIWCLLSWSGLLPHPKVGYALGAITTLTAAGGVAADYPDLGIWLGLFTALALLAAGAAMRSLVLSGLAIVGLFGWVTAALGRYVGFDRESGVTLTLILLVIGLAVLAGALVLGRHTNAPTAPASLDTATRARAASLEEVSHVP